jgi:hypothetical protein
MDRSSSLSGSSAYLESLMRAGQLTMKQFDDALASTMGASGNYPTPGRSGNRRVSDSRRPANARIPARRSPDDGCGNAGLPVRGYAQYRAFDESRTAGAGYFGASFGGLPKWSIGFVL